MVSIVSGDHDRDMRPPLLDRGGELSISRVDMADAADDETYVHLVFENAEGLFSTLHLERPVISSGDRGGGEAPNSVGSNDQNYAFHQATPSQHTPSTAYTLGTFTSIACFGGFGLLQSHLLAPAAAWKGEWAGSLAWLSHRPTRVALASFVTRRPAD